jgi:protein TonB
MCGVLIVGGLAACGGSRAATADIAPLPEEEVDTPPEPVGGWAAFRRNVQYPERARLKGTEGVVVVRFVVDERGRTRDEEVVQSVGDGCDRAAIRAVIQTRFRPGRNAGEVVPVRMEVPVNFFLGQQ